MPRPRYRIGIDLGTTNSVLSYVDAESSGGGSRILPIPQWDTPTATAESETLPSLGYLTTEPERQAGFAGGAEVPEPAGGWIVGRFARAQMALSPGRVIHSAKSWLSHEKVDRREAILPWQSGEVDQGQLVPDGDIHVEVY